MFKIIRYSGVFFAFCHAIGANPIAIIGGDNDAEAYAALIDFGKAAMKKWETVLSMQDKDLITHHFSVLRWAFVFTRSLVFVL